MKIKEIRQMNDSDLQAKLKDLKVELFSNSPPWYMTQSGCNTGNFDASKDA